MKGLQIIWALWFFSVSLINMRPRTNLKNKFGRELGVRKNLRMVLKNQSRVLMNWVELIELWSLFFFIWRKWSHIDNKNSMHMIHEIDFLKLIINRFHSSLDSENSLFQQFSYSLERYIMNVWKKILFRIN